MSGATILVPLITPLDSGGEVCERSVRRLLAGCRPSAGGYVPCLTSGEGWLLDTQQWQHMLAATLKHAQGCQVVAGIERSSTGEVIALARRAQHLGAAAIMITTPFGSDVEQSEMIEHYRAVHDAVALPVNIYNENALSGNEITFDSLLDIASLSRVVGIKDSSRAPRSLAQVGALRRLGVAYYTGWEQQLTALPADGSVVSLANLEPALCRAVHLCGSPALQVEVDRLTHHYQLDTPDWYRHIKRNLVQRGVIATDRTVDPVVEGTS